MGYAGGVRARAFTAAPPGAAPSALPPAICAPHKTPSPRRRSTRRTMGPYPGCRLRLPWRTPLRRPRGVVRGVPGVSPWAVRLGCPDAAPRGDPANPLGIPHGGHGGGVGGCQFPIGHFSPKPCAFGLYGRGASGVRMLDMPKGPPGAQAGKFLEGVLLQQCLVQHRINLSAIGDFRKAQDVQGRTAPLAPEEGAHEDPLL